nr:PepSY domain-containing protein [Bradyrhizobium guangdongense]
MLAGVLLAPVPAAAGDHDRGAPDAVRRAVEAGEIKSLADILASVRGKLPGEVAGVEIERERGRWIYEFRVVDDKGRLYEAYVDARSGEIERIKEK